MPTTSLGFDCAIAAEGVMKLMLTRAADTKFFMVFICGWEE
jgi:hypothetical protein